MDTIRYYDIRLVNGHTISIQTENGAVENAGSSYSKKALIRVLGKTGWGYACVSPFDMDDEKAKRAAVERAAKLAWRVCRDDPRVVSAEVTVTKAGAIPGLESAAATCTGGRK